MPTGNSDPPSVPLAALERGLDELSELVRSDGEPAQFFRELLRFLVHTARADEAMVWLRTSEEAWTRLALSISQRDGTQTAERITSPPAWIAEALTSTGMLLSRFTTETQTGQRVAGPVRQAGQATGVLAVQFEGTALPIPAATLVPFCAALSELTGDLLVQNELRRLRRERDERHQWEQWETTLAAAARLSQLAGIVAHDGRALCQADRITVLRATDWRVQPLVVSGVDTLDPRSATLQALEGLARLALYTNEPRYLSATEAPAEFRAAWEQLVTAAGTKDTVVVPLKHARGGPLGVLIAERFADSPVASEAWTSKVNRLATVVTPWWAALAESERTTWNRWFVRSGSQSTPRRAHRFFWGCAIACAAVMALVLIPAPLVIVAEGELVPVERRDVFATANGIVEAVNVRHGDQVAQQQPLVVLRDPAIELDAARVTGELATVRARLSTVRAARITQTSNAADSSQRTQQLAGEEEDLQQQYESLTKQKTLLDTERASWNLTSPIAGQVLTWDVETLLSGRPVERGQVLLSVGNTAGDWEIAARVRERHVGQLFAVGTDPQGLPVEFVSSTESGRTLAGRVANVSRVAEINERGESTVRVTVAFDQKQATQLKPGLHVWTRIQCGYRSLGYVWFHDLLDAVRRQFWLWR